MYNLHDFEPTFPLYLNIKNDKNPAQKHFEETNILFVHSVIVCA